MINEMSTVVQDVGRRLLEIRNTDAIRGEWRGAQLKTEADMLAHSQMSTLLCALDGSIPVVSEEDLDSQGCLRPERYWLIDPIDGTASYSSGYPGFVTQVALMEKREPLIAAIYAPAFDHLYLAEKGRGAFLNGERLVVSSQAGRKILIDNYPEPRGAASVAMRELGFSNYLECGSISLKICRVADGSADVFFKDVVVRDWDIAAPHLVLQEAGGSLNMLDGSPVLYQGSYEKKNGIVASCEKTLCSELVAWFTRHSAQEHIRRDE